MNLPPLTLYDGGETIYSGGLTLRSDVAEWCAENGITIQTQAMKLNGGTFEVKGILNEDGTPRKVNMIIQVNVLVFASETDMAAFKLRWR